MPTPSDPVGDIQQAGENVTSPVSFGLVTDEVPDEIVDYPALVVYGETSDAIPQSNRLYNEEISYQAYVIDETDDRDRLQNLLEAFITALLDISEYYGYGGRQRTRVYIGGDLVLIDQVTITVTQTIQF